MIGNNKITGMNMTKTTKTTKLNKIKATKERYKFTQPINKNRKTDYFLYLELVEADHTDVTHRFVKKSLHKSMTFQSFVQKGLVEVKKGVYNLTPKGRYYISLVDSGHYSKQDLRNLINMQAKQITFAK